MTWKNFLDKIKTQQLYLRDYETTPPPSNALSFVSVIYSATSDQFQLAGRSEVSPRKTSREKVKITLKYLHSNTNPLGKMPYKVYRAKLSNLPGQVSYVHLKNEMIPFNAISILMDKKSLKNALISFSTTEDKMRTMAKDITFSTTQKEKCIWTEVPDKLIRKPQALETLKLSAPIINTKKRPNSDTEDGEIAQMETDKANPLFAPTANISNKTREGKNNSDKSNQKNKNH